MKPDFKKLADQFIEETTSEDGVRDALKQAKLLNIVTNMIEHFGDYLWTYHMETDSFGKRMYKPLVGNVEMPKNKNI